MRISIIGLGYIGLPTSIAFAKAGHQVYGFDLNFDIVDQLNNGQIHIKEERLSEIYETIFESGNFHASTELMEADVYLIAVPTPFINDGDHIQADLHYVERAASSVAKKLKRGDLVILESTSPPQTTKTITGQLARESGLNPLDFHTVYCPERVLPGNILFELEHNDRIVGSDRAESALMARDLYKTIVGFGNIYITDDVTAEMCKLVENSYRDVNIAFANELSMICNKLGINVNELIDLSNKHPRVNILSPGVGVGGHCIAVDPYFIVEKFPEDAKLIAQARGVNENKTYWVAGKIEEKINYDKSTTIGILGLAYKANIDDLRESPSIKLAKYLQKKGYNVIACEPNIYSKSISGILLYSLLDILKKADFCIMTLRHDEFIKSMDLIEQGKTWILC